MAASAAASITTTMVTSTTAPAASIYTPAGSCLTSALSIPATPTPTTYGGTVFNTVFVGCPNNAFLGASVGLQCCGPFTQSSVATAASYANAQQPIIGRGQVCPASYYATATSTQGAETTGICCPNGFSYNYLNGHCFSSFTSTVLATGSELLTVTNSVAFGLTAVWNQYILSNLHTSVATAGSPGITVPGSSSSGSSNDVFTKAENKLGTTGIIGIAVAVTVLACIISIFSCLWKKRKQASLRKKNAARTAEYMQQLNATASGAVAAKKEPVETVVPLATPAVSPMNELPNNGGFVPRHELHQNASERHHPELHGDGVSPITPELHGQPQLWQGGWPGPVHQLPTGENASAPRYELDGSNNQR